MNLNPGVKERAAASPEHWLELPLTHSLRAHSSLLGLVHEHQKQKDELVGETGTREMSVRTEAEQEELERETEGRCHQDSC